MPTTRSAPTDNVNATSPSSSRSSDGYNGSSRRDYVKGTGCDYHKNTTHLTSNCYTLKRKREEEQQDQDAQKECYHCGKPGHRQYNCPVKRAERSGSRGPYNHGNVLNSTTSAAFGQSNMPVLQQPPMMFNPFGQMMTGGFDMNAYSNWLGQLYNAHQASVAQSQDNGANNRAIMPPPPSTPTPAAYTASSSKSSSSSPASSATDLSDR
ncbi:hypothetical protein EDC01DRAFT_628231 [Geopyxis carbonaria]|nr:hypothetical protein EDC01DRAFT_628231 [Geopyxis carbonaria]